MFEHPFLTALRLREPHQGAVHIFLGYFGTFDTLQVFLAPLRTRHLVVSSMEYSQHRACSDSPLLCVPLSLSGEDMKQVILSICASEKL